MGVRVVQRIVSAVAAVVLLAAGAVAATEPARASDWWCWDDPVLVIDNQVVQILAGVPESARTSVRLALITVIVPAGVDARITASTSPRFPSTSLLVQGGARAADGSVSVTAVMLVQATGAFQTALRMRQPSGAEVVGYGASNGAVTGTIQLQGKTHNGVRTGQMK